MDVLTLLRGDEKAAVELEEIKAANQFAHSLGQPRWAELFAGKIGRLLAIGAGIQVLQQLVGMNAFMYFGPRIFKTLGLNENVFQTMNNAVNFIASFPAIFLADRCGRRPLLLGGAFGMLFACVFMGSLGLLFLRPLADGSWETPAGGVGQGIMLAVFTFVACFAATWGPIAWVYCGEIYPLKYRARCIGLTTLANWLGNFLVAQFTPVLLDTLGFGTFLVFGLFCGLSFGFSIWLPETRGLPLERVEELFDLKLGYKTRRATAIDAEVVGLQLEECSSSAYVDD